MSNLKLEEIVSGATEFLKTPWGQWYVQQLEDKEGYHVSRGQGSEDRSVQVSCLMKSAGLREAIDLIKSNANLADTDFLK